MRECSSWEKYSALLQSQHNLCHSRRQQINAKTGNSIMDEIVKTTTNQRQKPHYQQKRKDLIVIIEVVWDSSRWHVTSLVQLGLADRQKN